MKLVILCNNQSNQIALVEKINKVIHVDGVVFEERVGKNKKKSIKLFFDKFLDFTLFFLIRKAWKDLLKYYSNYNISADIDTIRVNKINTQDTINFIKKHNPDYVLISGTSLIKKDILEIENIKGFINLHTGLSPYIKGGPNCTNWCISTNQSYLIGNTIMWLDLGIDSGNIIATELTKLDGNESLIDTHIKVMNHAHQMYIDVLCALRDNKIVNNIKQSSICEGNTYYTKMWSNISKLNLLVNFFNGLHKNAIRNQNDLIKKKNILIYPTQ